MSDLGITVASGNHVLRNIGYRLGLFLKNSISKAILLGFTYRSVKLWNSLPNKFYIRSICLFQFLNVML